MGAEDVRDLEGRTSHGNLGRVRGLKGADDFAQEIGRHLRIECGRLQLLVAEQDLNDADVDLLFEEVSRKTVSQDMHRDWLVDLGGECGGVDGPVELAGTDRLDRVQSREQLAALKHLALGTGDSPPAAQALKQHGGKHGVAVLVPLTLLDPQCHALAVDVAHLQPNHFAHAQSRAVGHRQRHLVFQVAGGGDQTAYFIPAQHHGECARHPHRLHLGHQLVPIELDVEAELESGDGRIERAGRGAVID